MNQFIDCLDKLPVGTKFFVNNGSWAGEVIRNEAGNKLIHIPEINSSKPATYFKDLNIRIISKEA